ncbi:MAG: DUF4080 domain-containing protein, partial [Syntrophomonadaceae bacterium]|nr:DUF4080 domain-containing protein [Syntrophomonadaceae bacterium]
MRVVLATLNASYSQTCLALYSLAAYCRGEFPDIQLLEFTINDDPGEAMAEILARQPDVLGLSCYIWNVRPLLCLVDDLAQVAPEVCVILGGPEAGHAAEEVLLRHPGVDWVVRGEGEATLLEILRTLRDGGEGMVAGASRRVGHQVVHGPDRAPLSDLGGLPFAYGEGLPDLEGRLVYYEGSRGCPFACSYCLSAADRGVRWLPLERTARELSWLAGQGARIVKLVDRSSNVDGARFRELLQVLSALDTECCFHFEVLGDRLDEGTLSLLDGVPPGRFRFEIGIQSTNQAVLRAVNRLMDWERMQAAVRRLTTAGRVAVHLDLIAGLPGEDWQSFARSFDAVYALQPDYLQLGFLKLLKGSVLRAQAPRWGYAFSPHPPYEVLRSGHLGYRELRRLHRIEDMVDRYHNSGDFRHCLRWFTGEVYQGEAFAFFEQLAGYWEERGLHRRPPRKPGLYEVLVDFAARRDAG